MRGTLRTPYILLFILLICCFTTYFSIASQSSWVKNFALEMASEILGIFLVIFSVDRVIENEQIKERNKLESVAFLQLRRPLICHFYLLFNMFKASVTTKPDKDYENLSSLFDDVFSSK